MKSRYALLPAGTVLSMRLQQARAHHRRQGQRDDRRHRDGADQGEGEFGEQRAGQAALEADRHVDRDQHDGHRDDRPAQLARGRRAPPAIGVMPSSRWRLTFSTTMMASSTTRPMASTSASSVSRLMEKPKHQHHREGADQRQRDGDRRESAPSASEPRNANTTSVTISSASTRRLDHLVDRAVHEVAWSRRRSSPSSPCGSCAWMSGKTSCTPRDDVEQVGGRARPGCR